MIDKYSYKVYIGGYRDNFENHNEINAYIDKAIKNKIKTEQIEIITVCDKDSISSGITNIAEVYSYSFNQRNENKSIIRNRITHEMTRFDFDNQRGYDNSLKVLYKNLILNQIDACLLFVTYWYNSLDYVAYECLKRNIPLIVYDCNTANGNVIKQLSNKEIINQIKQFREWREHQIEL